MTEFPAQIVKIHHEKVIASHSHHGIESPTIQILWPDKTEYQAFANANIEGFDYVDGHQYVLEIKERQREVYEKYMPRPYQLLRVISDEKV